MPPERIPRILYEESRKRMEREEENDGEIQKRTPGAATQKICWRINPERILAEQ